MGEVENEVFFFSNLLQVLSGHGPRITPGKDEIGLGDKIFQASSLCLKGSWAKREPKSTSIMYGVLFLSPFQGLNLHLYPDFRLSFRTLSGVYQMLLPRWAIWEFVVCSSSSDTSWPLSPSTLMSSVSLQPQAKQHLAFVAPFLSQLILTLSLICSSLSCAAFLRRMESTHWPFRIVR